MEVVNDDDVLDNDDGLPGMESVEEFKTVDVEQRRKTPSVEALTNSEINRIQEYLHTINRPTWHRGPPSNLGDAEHGKLKAEQWRSSIEFDLPVILCRLWGPGNAQTNDNEINLRREKLAHCTMLLGMAIQWGTSQVTSEHHACQYKKYMTTYLECLQAIFPELAWRPNHHASLHIDYFLRRYGPMHGWWMFPFERIIGTLQDTNTNHKIGRLDTLNIPITDMRTGELEKTMLMTFCAAAKVKALMQHPEAPRIVRDANYVLQQCCGTAGRGTFATEISILDTATEETNALKWSVDSSPKEVNPPADIQRALIAASVGLEPNQKLEMFSRCNVLGIKYATRAVSRRDGSIFLKGPRQPLPAVIEHIFAVPSKDGEKKYYIATRKHLPVPQGVLDPFPAYKDFGAGLWSDEYATDLEVVPLVGNIFCHAISMPWEDGVVVMKPLDKVNSAA